MCLLSVLTPRCLRVCPIYIKDRHLSSRQFDVILDICTRGSRFSRSEPTELQSPKQTNSSRLLFSSQVGVFSHVGYHIVRVPENGGNTQFVHQAAGDLQSVVEDG